MAKKRRTIPIKKVEISITSPNFNFEVSKEMKENKITPFINKVRRVKENRAKGYRGMARETILNRIKFDLKITEIKKA